MARSARRPERRRQSLATRAAMATAEMIFANPIAVGGATAFLVAFSFISANALWYQPGPHEGAFLSTRLGRVPSVRSVGDGSETTIRIERAEDQPPARPLASAAPPPDETLRRVQEALSERGVYSGTLDGLSGPQTRQAIETFRGGAGLPAGQGVDDALLEKLGLQRQAAIPLPQPREGLDRTPTAGVTTPDPVIVQIQAGLRAFGNDGIALDGVPGSKTRAAIREFQSLFGLKVDGEPDEALLAKMKDVGLVN